MASTRSLWAVAVALAGFASMVRAAPAPTWPVPATQPDGEELQVRMFGDEHGAFVESLDGYTLEKDGAGTWRYAVRGADGRLAPSSVRAGGSPAALQVPKHLRHGAVHMRKIEEARRAANTLRRGAGGASATGAPGPIAYAPGSAAATATPSAPYPTNLTDTPAPPSYRLAVILADFSDLAGTYQPEQFQQVFFSTGTYRTTPAGRAVAGSAKEYLTEASHGKLAFSGTVTGWVHTNKPRSTYLYDSLALYRDAVAASGLDLSQYDGYAVVFAGRESYNTAYWPMAALRGPMFRVPESYAANDITDIGVIVHEFAHVLGLYDLYNLENNPGPYDPMAMGQSNCGGLTPAHYSFYSKLRLGWVTATRLEAGTHQRTLGPWATTGAVDQLVGEQSYFFVENRQRTGFDACLPAGGLLVYHYDVMDGYTGLDLEEASGSRGDAAGAPFPRSGKNRLDCSTVPSSIEPDTGRCAVALSNLSAVDVPPEDTTTSRLASYDATVSWSGRGITVDGGGDYPSLFTAIEAASAGQTVTVPGGEFLGHVRLKPGVAVRGAGPGRTVLRQPRATSTLVIAADASSVSGVTLQGEGQSAGPAHYAGLSGPGAYEVSNAVVRDFSVGVDLQAAGSRAVNCVLDGNGIGVQIWAADAVVENDGFVGNGTGVQVQGGGTSPRLDFNAFHANGTDVAGVASWGTHNVSGDPLFAQPVVGNYALQAASPLRDAGDPAGASDPDGTPADIGAFGGPLGPTPPVDATPIADAGVAALKVSRGDVATFDASLSLDDGGIVSFAWDLDDDGVVDATTPRATHVYAENGRYSARLVVRDAAGLESHDVVTVDVVDPPVEVVRPAAGEVLVSGTSTYVSWEFRTGEGARTFHVSYSLDGGATWTEIGTVASSSWPQSVAWTVPQVAEFVTDAVVQVVSYDGAGALVGTDLSEPFTVRPQLPRTLLLDRTAISFAPRAWGSGTDWGGTIISSLGTETVTVSSVVLSGTGASQFSLYNPCGAIAPGSTCYLQVGFAPTKPGVHEATITITSDDSLLPVQTIRVTGTATGPVPPKIAVSPAAVTFGTVLVGTNTIESVSVSNQGEQDLVVSSVTLTGASDVNLQNGCGTVAPGGSCTVNLLLVPTAPGPRSGSVVLQSNDRDAPTVTVPFSGTVLGVSKLGYAPTSLTFPSTNVPAASAAQTVTVTNAVTATAELTVTSVALAGANAADYRVASGCAAPLPPGGSCALQVTFAPQAAGTRTATLTFASNDPAQPSGSVSLTGTAVALAARIGVSPASLEFGSVNLGASSAVHSAQVSNAGEATLTVSSIAVAGANAAEFLVRGSTCGDVAPGGTCVVDVAFVPASAGTRSASLAISSNDGASPIVGVPLSGTGVAAPKIAVSPTSLSFGTVAVNTTSTAQSVTVSNQGTATLSVGAPAFGGTDGSQFRIVSNGCSTVAPGGTCQIGVAFAPTSTGTMTGTLSIASNDPAGAVVVTLTGTGTSTSGPKIGVSPSSLSFGGVVVNTASPSQAVTVSNTGGSNLVVSAPALTGTYAAQFRIASNDCTTVAPGASCTIRVAFAPSSAGSRTATLSIRSNDPASPTKTVSLSGYGAATSSPRISVSPSSLSLGSVTRNTVSSSKTVTVTNQGAANLTVSAPTLGGTSASQFRITSNGCTSAVAPGKTCQIRVAFAPTSTGSKTATLSIPSNDPASPIKAVGLSGTGL